MSSRKSTRKAAGVSVAAILAVILLTHGAVTGTPALVVLGLAAIAFLIVRHLYRELRRRVRRITRPQRRRIHVR